MAISTRMSRNPVTPSAQSPSIGARPSSSRPSSVKNSMAASMSSTTMPTLSIRLTVMMSPWQANLLPLRQRVLVELSILHDQDEVLDGVLDELDVLDRVAVDDKQVGQRAFFDDTELAGIRIALPGQRQQLGVGPRRHDERFGGAVPTDQLGQQFPVTLGEARGEQDIRAERTRTCDGADSRPLVPSKMRTFWITVE